MLREPGVPIYLRPPNVAFITLAFILFGCTMVYVGTHESWMLVVVICFGTAVTLLALARMEWSILGLVAMANFDGFLKPLFAERFSLFFKDYFILLALVRWVWGLLLGEDRSSLRTSVAIPAALFMGYVVSEIANPNAASILASLAGIRGWLMWIPLFFVAYDALRSRAAVERLWVFAIGLSLVVAAYGIVQYFIGFEHLYHLSRQFESYTGMAYVTGEGQRVLRVFSTTVHPGAFGGAMGFMALACTGMAFAAQRPAARILALICLPLVVVGLFLSGARTAVIGTGLGLAIFLLLARRPVLLAGAAALIFVGLWQAVKLTGGGLEARLETVTWERAQTRAAEPLTQGFEMAWRHPFGMGVGSGVGVGSFGLSPDAKRGPFIESDIGRAFSELGLGAVLYVLLLLVTAAASLRAYARARDSSTGILCAALIGAVVVMGASLATGAALYLAPGAAYFWLGLASVLRLPETEAIDERSREEAPLPETRRGVLAAG